MIVTLVVSGLMLVIAALSWLAGREYGRSEGLERSMDEWWEQGYRVPTEWYGTREEDS